MKKSNLLFFLFLNVASFLFGVELWNGFTTDMTREQISARAIELFGTNSLFREENSSRYNTGEILIGSHYKSGPIDTKLYFRTGNTAYPIVSFHFRNNVLYIIQIRWGSEAEILLNRHRNQFGNPYETKRLNDDVRINHFGIKYYTITRIDYKWQNSGMYIFLATTILPQDYPLDSNNDVVSYFMNREIYDAWQAEVNAEQRQKEEAEQQKRREASEGITF